MFVVNYLRQMSISNDHLKMLINHDNIVNRVLFKFFQNDDIDYNSKISFAQFNMSRQILRSHDLLKNQDYTNNFLEICPDGFWKKSLRDEFLLYHESNSLELLREFREMTLNQLVLTTGYNKFRREIHFISDRITNILNEIYSSINRNNDD